jgi:hypothetical protein
VLQSGKTGYSFITKQLPSLMTISLGVKHPQFLILNKKPDIFFDVYISRHLKIYSLVLRFSDDRILLPKFSNDWELGRYVRR